jgi:arylsulfatase A-like enzyme
MTAKHAMRQSLLRGATCGCLAWIVYGTIELVLSCGTQLWRSPEVEITTWQWQLIAMLFGAYAAAGLLLGAMGGLALAWTKLDADKRNHEIAAVLTLVVAFVINLIPAWPLARSEYLAVAVALLLAGAFGAAFIISDGGRNRIQFLINPWIVSCLLLGAPWVSREALGPRSSTAAKTGLSLMALCVIVAIAALQDRWKGGRAATAPGRIVTAAAVFAAFGIAVLFEGRTSALGHQSATHGASARPSVLLITMDTVRADHVSANGYTRDTTPHLRDFSRQATVFSNAIATSDFTLPTHASIFTGLYPDWHGANFAPPEYSHGRPLPPDQVTLAEVLRSQGYWTAEVVANFAYLAPGLGLTKGFEIADWDRPVNLSSAGHPFFLREGAERILSKLTHVDQFYQVTRRAEEINRRAFGLLDQRGKNDGPFFLFLNYMDAHYPYYGVPGYKHYFPGENPNFDGSSYLGLRDHVISGKKSLTPAERSNLNARYDEGIAYIDSEIGKLLARFRELGIYDDSLIIITSDHGETFGERGLLSHGVGHVSQALVHVPLLIKFPGQHESRQVGDPVSQVDLMPTVLQVTGSKQPPGLQGRVLRSDGSDGRGSVYARATPESFLTALNPAFQGIRRAVFDGSTKLITWTAGPPEIYDLESDPGEEHNLYHPGDPRATALADRLATWEKTMPRQKTQPGQLDKSTLERLKSLGYVQ